MSDLILSFSRIVAELAKIQKETTASLYALRDSTQKSFDDVKSDIESFMKLGQKLNERVSAAEGEVSALSLEIESLENRIQLLESKPLEQKKASQAPVFANNGEMILVVSRVPANANDPACFFPYVAQQYVVVVSNFAGPTLVPTGPPMKVTAETGRTYEALR
jgi:hypothetical protein